MRIWAGMARKLCSPLSPVRVPPGNGYVADHKGAAVASNYEAICEENRQRYGTESGGSDRCCLPTGTMTGLTSSLICCRTPAPA